MAVPGELDVTPFGQAGGTDSAGGGVMHRLDADGVAAGLGETLRATLGGLAPGSPGETAGIGDVIITTEDGHHFLEPLETVFDDPLMIYARLDTRLADPASARRRPAPCLPGSRAAGGPDLPAVGGRGLRRRHGDPGEPAREERT
ncbi:hypothetical protein ACFQ08_18765, partial [Streptosporangium algeriense]